MNLYLCAHQGSTAANTCSFALDHPASYLQASASKRSCKFCFQSSVVGEALFRRSNSSRDWDAGQIVLVKPRVAGYLFIARLLLIFHATKQCRCQGHKKYYMVLPAISLRWFGKAKGYRQKNRVIKFK